MNRDHSATGFSPPVLQTATRKRPPFEGGNGGGKHRSKPPKNPDYWPLADSADIRRKKSAPIRVICAQNEAAP